MNTLSSLLSHPPLSSSARSPEAEIRAIVEKQAGISQLPATKGLSLYHIRGVSNPKFSGGEDRDSVIFVPEFLYVLDVGFPSACGVQVAWSNSGSGDPYFPKFDGATVRSVSGRSHQQLLHPCVPSDLLVGVKAGTSEETVRTTLAAYSTSISVLIPDLYTVSVRAFHEQEIARTIESSVPFVKYASLNTVVRLKDFTPGWFVDQVC